MEFFIMDHRFRTITMENINNITLCIVNLERTCTTSYKQISAGSGKK
jgi:hypothetical protein